MQYKDWIMLLVPVFCNGIINYILQNIFEKKQSVRTIKFEYISNLRNMIDTSLGFHAKATRLANNPDSDGVEISNTLAKYVDSCLDVYYYYIQNKPFLNHLDDKMEKLAKSIEQLAKCSHETNLNYDLVNSLYNGIRDILLKSKKDCVEY